MSGSVGVVVLSGPPCSGKSQVGRRLAVTWPQTARHVVEVDAVYALLLPNAPRRAADRQLAYELAHGIARTLLDSGQTPILECSYSRRAQRASLASVLAERPSTPLWVVEFSVPADVAVARYRLSSSHQATNLTEELVRERAQTFPSTTSALQLASDTESTEALADAVTCWLRAQATTTDPESWVAAGLP